MTAHDGKAVNMRTQGFILSWDSEEDGIPGLLAEQRNVHPLHLSNLRGETINFSAIGQNRGDLLSFLDKSPDAS